MEIGERRHKAQLRHKESAVRWIWTPKVQRCQNKEDVVVDGGSLSQCVRRDLSFSVTLLMLKQQDESDGDESEIRRP